MSRQGNDDWLLREQYTKKRDAPRVFNYPYGPHLSAPNLPRPCSIDAATTKCPFSTTTDK